MKRNPRFGGRAISSLRKYQGGWVQIIYWLVALIITIVLAPKPATPRAAAIEDFDLPVAEADRPIPVLFGRKRITGANVLWYGNLSTSKIKKRSLFSSTTVGYKYYLSMHMGFCLGPVDAFHAIDVGDKRAWTGNQTANGIGGINEPNLFGGEKREGGISGIVTFLFGASDQIANSYLISQINQPMPAFRGIACILFNNSFLDIDYGGYVGTTPYVKPWAVTCSRILKGWHNDTVWYPEKANVNGGMNAAHIIYQCLTDPEWGMGAPTALVDDTNFRALADTCFTEGLGLNLLWNQTTTIEDFVQIVLDHIAGGLGFDPASGKYIVTLIRGDYVASTLPLFNNSNMDEIQDFQRRAWAETINELAISYTDATTGKAVPIVVQDLGNIRAQSARIPEKIDRTGITSLDVIRVVAGRELASRSTPLARIDFTCNRAGWNVQPYGVIRITRTEPEMQLNETVFRIVDIKKGNLERGKITISAIEDIYGLSGIEYGEEQPQEPDSDPILPPDDGPDNGNTVTSSTTTTPPAAETLTDGERFLVPTGATGAWAGHEGQIAEWDEDEQTWFFIEIPPGSTIYDQGNGQDVSIDEYGEAGPPRWTPAIPPLTEDLDPDPAQLMLAAYNTDTETYVKVAADEIGGGGGATVDAALSLALFAPGTPTSSKLLMQVTVPDNWTLPGNMTDSLGHVGTNPTGSFVMDVAKNGSNVGTITISTAGAFTFATTSSNPVAFAAGDKLTVTAPSSTDATVADISVNLYVIGVIFDAGRPSKWGGAFFFPGTPGNNQLIARVVLSSLVRFPANFTTSFGDVGTNPGATVTLTVWINSFQAGTITISTGGAFTFASTGGVEVLTAAGDLLSITNQASADGTLANVSLTLVGELT